MAAQTGHNDKINFPYLRVVSIGIAVLSTLAVLAAQTTDWPAAVGISLLIFLAAAAIGAALGFLFAVPRLLSRSANGGDAPPATEDDAGRAGLSGRLLHSNTNLERISDWLTTMLVGVGLTQVANIGSLLIGFGEHLGKTAHIYPAAPGIAASAGSLPIVGPMVLIFGFVAGFLYVYVYTRVFLAGIFNRTERALFRETPDTASVPEAVGKEIVREAKQLSHSNPDPDLNALASADASTVSVGEALGVMFNLLYQPGGYQRVIAMAPGLKSTPAAQTPEFWYYLAAAHGQEHHKLQLEKASETLLKKARADAFDAARQAVKRDRSFTGRLWAISDPDDGDNDLMDFRDDPEFRAIVHRPATPATAVSQDASST